MISIPNMAQHLSHSYAQVTRAGHHDCVDFRNIRSYGAGMKFDADLDALGLLCPLPVLKARKRLEPLATGQVLRVRADDPAAVIDVPHFCTEQGHHLLDSQTDGTVQTYFIRKG